MLEHRKYEKVACLGRFFLSFMHSKSGLIFNILSYPRAQHFAEMRATGSLASNFWLFTLGDTSFLTLKI